ncbi:polysaccharide deacetylase [Gracilibacillus boraciitolerans JCM 21714]|uniref:Polysaccharide deacetylase n=1 Tax=Gracilibacillus boraciitolerans JCM 21714 TaxID=1298598 RepID=W4VJ11_9BACI|nr:polysaccharide deacetylase family protein [Gracilibacillus boraciitolerans]GAE93202.1 polysaccharide deacetylase [Gracilibacillus boraciitolerans JCM 21714]
MSKVTMTFPKGKHKVLTMSYDDGKSADRRLVKIFNNYGIKGTFHLNSGLLGEGDRIPADEISSLYHGHEVSAHTVTHPTIARSSKEQIIEEVMEDRKGLEEILDYSVRGLSYPNGSYNQLIKDMLPFMGGIEYARTVHSTGNFDLPDNFIEWHPTCHHNHNLMDLADTFSQLDKKQYLNMLYVWGHSYEFDHDQNWEVIEQFCEFIGNRSDIWYATNIDIVDYINAFRNLKFSANSHFVYNPSIISVWLNVEEEIVEVPGGKKVILHK